MTRENNQLKRTYNKRNQGGSGVDGNVVILFGTFALLGLFGLLAFLKAGSSQVNVSLPTQQTISWGEVEAAKAVLSRRG